MNDWGIEHMIRCSKCNGMPNENDVIGWKCNSCGKAFQVKKEQLYNILVKKEANPEKSLCKCPSCGNIIDDGKESIAWKCSCGHVTVGKLYDFKEEGKIEEREDKEDVVPDVPIGNLINCPECGKEISSKAKKCVHCGYPLKKGKDAFVKKIGATVAVIVVGVICTIVIIISNQLNETEQAEVERVSVAIADIGEVSLFSEKKISNAEKMYDELSKKCQRHVENRKNMSKARETYDKLKAEETINLIDKIEIVNLESQNVIEIAKKYYDALTDEQKKLVSNEEKLLSSIEELSNLKIDFAENQIADIGEVTLKSEKDIKAAREAYDALADKEKQKVTRYNELTDAETVYEDLAVKNCVDLINAIGTVSLESKEKISEAKKVYISLSKDLKSKVTNYTVLTNADFTYTQLVKEDEERKKTIKPGDSFSTSKWEVTYKKTNITAKILPNSTSGYYMYYYAEDDNTFVDVIFQIKNVNTDILGIEDLVGSCEVEYNGDTLTKNYSLFTSGGSQIDKVYMWDGLDALDSTTLHVAINMPREIQTNEKSVTVKLTIAGEEKIIHVR